MFSILKVSLMVGLLALSQAQQTYNISLSDQSPMIIYGPSDSQSEKPTWNATSPGTTSADLVDADDIPYNTSHVTDVIGATATVTWFGTEMWFWGEIKGSVRLLVDNSVVDQTAGLQHVMACALDLPNAWHNATLVVVSGWVEIWSASFTVLMGDNGTTTLNQTMDAVTKGNIAPSLDTSQGDWHAANCTITGGVASKAIVWTDWSYWFLETSTLHSNVSFDAPKNTSFVTVLGTVGPKHGLFSVSIMSSRNQAGPTPANQTHSTRSLFASEEVIYYASLDPTALYHFTAQFLGLEGQTWNIASVIFTSVNTTLPPASDNSNTGSKTPVGAIVGGAVGGAVAIVLLCLLAWYLIRRRKNKRAASSGTPADLVEDGPEARMTPFYEASLASGLSPRHDVTPGPMVQNAESDSGDSGYPFYAAGNSSAVSKSSVPPGSPNTVSSSSTSDILSRQSSPKRHMLATSPRPLPRLPMDGMQKLGLPTIDASQSGVRQESDAGRIQEEIVPPVYDPSWENKNNVV